jgi:hypothetical protein
VAAYPSIAWNGLAQGEKAAHSEPIQAVKPLEFTGVFLGRELTRKERRLSSGLALIDSILGGGVVRGRIAEIVGPVSAGKTSLAACFAASVTRRGEAAAWIDSAGALDPATIASAGVDLKRMLWVHPRADSGYASDAWREDRGGDLPQIRARIFHRKRPLGAMRAAELVLEAGGFGLVVIDFATLVRAIPQSAALRVARLAERTGAAVIVLATHRMCGTFAAQSLALNCERRCFNRIAIGAPTLFDGFVIEARVARNKLGGVGAHARLRVLADPQRRPSIFFSGAGAEAGRDARPTPNVGLL